MGLLSVEDGSPMRIRLRSLVDAILPEINFITVHYIYFITTILVTAIIMWGAATPFRSVSFTDALFLTASAMTEAGLNTVNLSTLNTLQQIVLLFLMLAGSAIFVSFAVIMVRLRAFERIFRENIKGRREEKQKTKAEMRGAGFKRSKSIFTRARGQSRSEETEKANIQEAAEQPSDKEPSTSVSPKQAVYNAEKDVSGSEEHSSGASSSSEARPHLALQIDGIQDRGPDRTIAFSPDTHVPNMAMPGAPLAMQRSNTSHSSRNAGTRHERVRPSLFSFTGVGATAAATRRPPSQSLARSNSIQPTSPSDPSPHLNRSETSSGQSTNPWFYSASGYFTRNSQVHGLTFSERQELGGQEYSAIVFLAFIVPFYFFVWQILGVIALGAWVKNYRAYLTVGNGLNPFWVGAFNAISAFNNNGMMLLDQNMVAFQDSVFILLSMGLFILAGNTMYPVFLRVAIWAVWKVLPDDDFWKFDKQTLRFLLDHPRRCYTNLFPKRHTWWLGLCVLILNSIDWVAYPVLNIGNNAITSIRPNLEVIDGLFQSLAVRTGGFYVVNLSSIRISLQVLYLVMMYISAYPVAITMRNSNVYEERSLGIFAEDQEQEEGANATGFAKAKGGLVNRKKGNAKTAPFGGLKRTFTIAATAPSRENHSTFVRQQLRAQLSHDAWWICLAVFLIAIIEGGRFESNPTVFSAFNIMFEVVSGYACVGISIGVPWAAYSFSGAWHTLSKLVMVAVMIRGRHRGLPVAIDHAVQLPGPKRWEAEEEDGRVRMERNFTMREGQV